MLAAKPYLQQILIDGEAIASADQYPFNIPSIRSCSEMSFHPDVTFFVGENGSGKSTLLEAIALALGFAIEGGSNNMRLKTHDNSSELFNYIQTIRSYKRPTDHFFLRAESLYNVATYMEDIYEIKDDPRGRAAFKKQYGVGSLHECSHGESFIALLNHRLRGNGLYLFDEPEAALSPARQLTAFSLINELAREKGSQFIIATHSPILLAYPNAMIYQFDQTGIKRVNYEETEHYQITRYFLNNYGDMVKELTK